MGHPLNKRKTVEDLSKQLIMLSQCYTQKIEPDTIQLMAAALEANGITPELMRPIMSRIVAEEKFFPSVASIIEKLKEIHHTVVSETILRGIREYSIYDSHSFIEFIGPKIFEIYKQAGGERLRQTTITGLYGAIKEAMKRTPVDPEIVLPILIENAHSDHQTLLTGGEK